MPLTTQQTRKLHQLVQEKQQLEQEIRDIESKIVKILLANNNELKDRLQEMCNKKCTLQRCEEELKRLTPYSGQH
jgi:cell division protein FtsB